MKKSKLRNIIREEIQKIKEADYVKGKDYWLGSVGKNDDFGDRVSDEIIDGKTKQGPWALMTPKTFKKHGVGRLGIGYGQKYKKQSDGKWLKIESIQSSQSLIEALVKKGDFIVSDYKGRKLKDGSVAPEFGVVKTVNKGSMGPMAYVDFGIGTTFTSVPISTLKNTNKKEKGKTLWIEE